MVNTLDKDTIWILNIKDEYTEKGKNLRMFGFSKKLYKDLFWISKVQKETWVLPSIRLLFSIDFYFTHRRDHEWSMSHFWIWHNSRGQSTFQPSGTFAII